MKKAIGTLGLVCVLVLAGAAQGQAACPGRPCAAAGPGDDLLADVLVLRLAKDMDLDTAATVDLFNAHVALREKVQAAASKCKELHAALQAALDAGKGDAEVGAALAALKKAKAEMAALQQSAPDALGAGLTATQQAKVFLFLCELRGQMMPPAAAAAVAAPAEAPAAAPAPEASPKEVALKAAKAWGDALVAQDIDSIMAVFADDFEHYEYGDKEGIRDFIQQAVDMGYLEDLEVDLADAEVEIDGDQATVYPIELMGAFGSVTFELVFKNGKIVGLDASGI